MVASSLTPVPVRAAVSTGGAMTRSEVVVKMTCSFTVVDPVPTWVPEGTVTGCSRIADSQNVRFVRATDGGNGSMPTRSRNLA